MTQTEPRPPERSLTVRELCEDPGLGVELAVVAGESGLDRPVRGARVQKSGLALVGHFHGIEPARIQVLGVTEMRYLAGLCGEGEDKVADCARALARYFALDLCCVVVSEGDATMAQSPAVDELCHAADEAETPLLVSAERSSRTIQALHELLDERLAPRQRLHGVLVDVFEVGLLLLGASGVGKSEIALELVMRGHRLVADDVVECAYRSPGMVFGAPASLLRHHLEVRGLGILNVRELFGVTAIRERKRIDVVVRLCEDVGDAEYDRLGLEQRLHRVLGVDIPELSIPVRPGRDVASILEVAARSELLKRGGHDSARDLVGRIDAGSDSSPPRRRALLRPAERAPESSVGMPLPTPRGPSDSAVSSPSSVRSPNRGRRRE